jgi:hypothetical protein
MSDAPNSLKNRRRKWSAEIDADDKPEAKAIILSVRLDNGSFESSVTIPLTEHIDFDKHASRWLALAHTALAHGVTDMEAQLALTKETTE